MKKGTLVGASLAVLGVVALLTATPLVRGKVGFDEAIRIAGSYASASRPPEIAVEEVMEFEDNYYVLYVEKATGIGAFEMLIDKTTGRIFPEYGPNMMWNTKYGHGAMMGGGVGGMMGGSYGGMMGGWSQPLGPAQVTAEEAERIAQRWLDEAYPGTKADEAHAFHGYYTIHVTRDGRVSGMLSVNGYTGSVWYHGWHGAFIQSREA